MLYVGVPMLLTVTIVVLDLLLSAAAVRLPRNLLSVKMKTCQEMPSPRATGDHAHMTSALRGREGAG